MSGCPHPQMPSLPAPSQPLRFLSHLLFLGCSSSIPPYKDGEVGHRHGRGGGHPGFVLLRCSTTHGEPWWCSRGEICCAHSACLFLQRICRSSLVQDWLCSSSASSWAVPCAGGTAGAWAPTSAGSGRRWSWDPLCLPGRCRCPSSSTIRRWQERCWVPGLRRVPQHHQHLMGVCSTAEPPCPASPSLQSQQECGSAAAASLETTSSATRKAHWSTPSWDPPPHCPLAPAQSSVPGSTATCSTHRPRPHSP